MNFVSEKELIKKREENPDDAGSSADDIIDNRPLYDRLKEVRDKKQLDWDEEHALKNQFAVTRGIDTGDADFLSEVDRIKEEQEARKRQEELELLKLAKESSIIPAPDPAQDRLDRPQRAPKQTTGKQASLISSLVRKRPHSSTEGDDKPTASVARSDSLPDNVDEEDEEGPRNKQQSAETGDQRQSNCKLIGILPGITNYSDSSDEAESSSNSESLESELPLVAVYAGKGAKKALEEQGH